LVIGDTLLDFVGNTPIVKIQKICPNDAGDIYVKLEDFNPGGSIKTRIALSMIIDAEKKGILKPNSGQTIIEPTGGNTGIGLSIIGAIRGYNVVLVVPDNYSKNKMKISEAYGARVILSDSRTGNNSHIKLVEKILSQNDDYIYLDQFSNLSNPLAHYEITGQEIVQSLDCVDSFVAGIGSGGTIMGIGKAIKEKFADAIIVGVQPKGCDVLKGKAIPHSIEGLAVGIMPKFLDSNVINKVISVDFPDVVAVKEDLAKKEGLFLGLSSSANICGALNMAKELGKGSKIVTIAPDGGRNYLV